MPLVEGGCERRIDHRVRPLDSGKLVEVHEPHLRIRRRLGDHEHGLAGNDRGGKGTRDRSVDERDVDPEASTRAIQERHRAAIELALSDDVVACGAQRKDHARDGPHPGSEGECILCTFEVRDCALESANRGVRIARVVADFVRGEGVRATLVEARRLPCGRRPDGRSE